MRCSIKSCSLRKDKKHPNLTLHRLPKNNLARKKWLDIVGSEDINFNSKCVCICSMHFEESCFNRTLDVIRLHDNSVPSLNLQTRMCASPPIEQSTSTTQELYDQSMTSTGTLAYQQSEKLKMLIKRCTDQRNKISRIAETIRRQEKKIAELDATKRDLIREIKNRNLIISDKSLFLDESASSRDIIRRQKKIAKRFYHIKALKNQCEG